MCVCVCTKTPSLCSRTPQNESFLIVSIRHRLEDVADRLCELGVDVNQADHLGNSPLWVALRSKQDAVAARLVSDHS